MNDAAVREMVDKATKAKFKRKQVLTPKSSRYPEGAEREYVRLTNAYMKIMNAVIAEHMGEIKKAVNEERATRRADDSDDMQTTIRGIFQNISGKLERRIKEWKRVCKSTIGIDITEN